jgi:parallel beta helix pectate lyase-like protein
MAPPSRHLLTALAAALSVALLPASASAAVTCDRVVAATGSDNAAGTPDAPFATPEKLAGSLQPGQTGCLRGPVKGSMWIEASRATVTSEPGQRGKLVGQVVIDPDADHVTVSDLDLDATGLGRPSPIVLGDDAVVARNDITNNHTPILCMIVGAKGHDSNATAERLLIEGNRIHDCGVSDNHRHGLYIEHAVDTRIVGNEIFDNADRGIQLYPDAQRTVITGNVIDGNGQGIIISGLGDTPASGTRIRNNVITNARLRAGVESWFPDSKGTDNLVEGNCVFGGVRQVDTYGGGFTARDNPNVDPQFVNRAAKDFRLREGSPCADLLAAGRSGAELPVTPASVPAEALQPKPEPTKDDDGPLRIALMRGAQTPRGRTVLVRVHAIELLPARTYARVEMRYRGRRAWRLVGIRRVQRGRPFAAAVRVPPRARDLAIRATLLRPGADEVVTFRARRH